MDAAGLAKLFPLDREARLIVVVKALTASNLRHHFGRYPQGVGHDRETGPHAQRRRQKAAVDGKDVGIGMHPAVRVQDGMSGVAAEAEGAALVGHVLIGRVPARGQTVDRT